jgi:hypothetical protein
MSDLEGYKVRGLGLGMDVDFHWEDMEPGLTTWRLLYVTKHTWALKACVELSKDDIMKTNKGSWAKLGFIIGGYFLSDNLKVCNDLHWGLLANSYVDQGMHS